MRVLRWWDARVKRLSAVDLGLFKIETGMFFLMIAALWKPLVSIGWYWFCALWILLMIKPVYRFFKN